MKLLTIIVADNNNNTRLAGQAIAEEESTPAISAFFEFIQQQYYHTYAEYLHPMTVVADGSLSIHNSADVYFGRNYKCANPQPGPDLTHFSCVFHMNNNLQKHAAKIFPAYSGKELTHTKNAVIAGLSHWAQAPYDHSLEYLNNCEQDMIELLHVNPANKDAKVTLEHIQKYKADILTQSSRTVNVYMGGSLASSRIEGHNGVLRKYGLNTHNYTDSLVSRTYRRILHESIHRTLFDYRSHKVTAQLLTPTCRNTISGGIASCFNDNVLDSRNFVVIQLPTDTKDVKDSKDQTGLDKTETILVRHKDYTVEVDKDGKKIEATKPRKNAKKPIKVADPPKRTFKIKQASYTYTISKGANIWRCNCNRDVGAGYPCPHLVCAFNFMKMQFSEEYFHPRFYLQLSNAPPSLKKLKIATERQDNTIMEPLESTLIPPCFNTPSDTQLLCSSMEVTQVSSDATFNDHMKKLSEIWHDATPEKREEIHGWLYAGIKQFSAPEPESLAFYNATGNTDRRVTKFGRLVDGY